MVGVVFTVVSRITLRSYSNPLSKGWLSWSRLVGVVFKGVSRTTLRSCRNPGGIEIPGLTEIVVRAARALRSSSLRSARSLVVWRSSRPEHSYERATDDERTEPEPCDGEPLEDGAAGRIGSDCPADVVDDREPRHDSAEDRYVDSAAHRARQERGPRRAVRWGSIGRIFVAQDVNYFGARQSKRAGPAGRGSVSNRRSFGSTPRKCSSMKSRSARQSSAFWL